MARFNPESYDPAADSSTNAASKFGVDAGTLVLVSSETHCMCGCGEARDPKRQFKPGHDARLKGKLSRALAASCKVTLIKTVKGEAPDARTVTAAAAIKAFGWSDIVKPAVSAGTKPAKKAAKRSSRKSKTKR